jgi:heme-degrading monooxygenase HmoA
VILRIFRARARPGEVDSFEERARSLGFDRMKPTPGLRAWIAGKPLDADARDFVMITVWDSEEALRAFAGETWRELELPVDERDTLEFAGVEHFELHEAALGEPPGGTDPDAAVENAG